MFHGIEAAAAGNEPDSLILSSLAPPFVLSSVRIFTCRLSWRAGICITNRPTGTQADRNWN